MANTLEIQLKEILQFISCLSHYEFNCFVRKRWFYIHVVQDLFHQLLLWLYSQCMMCNFVSFCFIFSQVGWAWLQVSEEATKQSTHATTF